MISVRARALVTAGALLALPVLAACSGGSSKPTASTSTSTQPTEAATTAAAGPADVGAATAQIKANWHTFFAYNTPRATAAKLLEDGDTMGAALAKAVQEQQQTHIKQGANVTGVTFSSPTTATVTYQLLNGKAVLLPAASGLAVLVDGTWKVGKQTFCTLVMLGNNNQPVPGC
jgi:hypothetical protein